MILETLKEKDQGEKLGLFPRGGPKERLKEMGLEDQFTVEGDRIVTPPKKEKPGDTGTGGTNRTGSRNDDDPEEPTVSAEDAIRENAELFKELLGEASKEDIKKARIQDASDYLLKFFAGTQKEGADVRSAAADVAEFAVSRDSRTDRAKEAAKKTDQTATALAINDYIAGKRSKEQINAMLAKLKVGADLKTGSINQQILDFYNKNQSFPSVTAIKRIIGSSEYANKEIVEINSEELAKNNQQVAYEPGDENKIFIDSITKAVFTYDNKGNRISVSG